MVDKEDYTQISIRDRVEKEFLPFFKQSKSWTGTESGADNSLWVERYNFLNRVMAQEFKAPGFVITQKYVEDSQEFVILQPSEQSIPQRSSLEAIHQPETQKVTADLKTKRYLEQFQPLFSAAKARLTELLKMNDPEFDHQEEIEMLSATLLALSSQENDPFLLITDVLSELSDLSELNKLRFF